MSAYFYKLFTAREHFRSDMLDVGGKYNLCELSCTFKRGCADGMDALCKMDLRDLSIAIKCTTCYNLNLSGELYASL